MISYLLVQDKVKQLKTEYNQPKTEQTNLKQHAISVKNVNRSIMLEVHDCVCVCLCYAYADASECSRRCMGYA